MVFSGLLGYYTINFTPRNWEGIGNESAWPLLGKTTVFDS